MSPRTWSRSCRVAAAIGLATATLASIAPSADAAAACAAVPAGAPIKVAQVNDWVESLQVDSQGRMYGTGYYTGKVYRIDRPGAAPVAITGNIGANAGLVIRPDGKLIVGTGNDIGTSVLGDFFPTSKLLLVDPETGTVTTYADKLGGIDGVALAADGTIYTTTVGGANIGRVTPDGKVNNAWAKLAQGNGIVVSPDQRYLYVIPSSVTPALYRIPIATPDKPERWINTDLLDAASVPDGMTLDSAGRPLVTNHVAGQIWRVENGRFCSIQNGMYLSTQVIYGQGSQGFSAGKLYRTGANGSIYEIPAGFDPHDQ